MCVIIHVFACVVFGNLKCALLLSVMFDIMHSFLQLREVINKLANTSDMIFSQKGFDFELDLVGSTSSYIC